MYRTLTAPACPDCKDQEETAYHVILDCPRYTNARLACRLSLSQVNLTLSAELAMGEVEHLESQVRKHALAATASLLSAIPRIEPPSRRRKRRNVDR